MWTRQDTPSFLLIVSPTPPVQSVDSYVCSVNHVTTKRKEVDHIPEAPLKKFPEILVRNFRSVRRVRVVSLLPKISGLSRRARLDSGYNMKLVRNSRNFHGKRTSSRNVPSGKTGLPFQNFSLFREFSSEKNQKNVYHLHPNRNFREFVVNGKQPW